MKTTAIVLAKKVGSKILVVRGHKVMLDSDLAELYGVTVKRLNQQITRNPKRFPADFLFTLTRAEYKNLRSHNATSSPSHGGRRYLPNVFTEHGAIMAASVLNSKRAIEMSIFVVRAFVQMREAVLADQRVAAKLAELESRIEHSRRRDSGACRRDSRAHHTAAGEQPPHRIRSAFHVGEDSKQSPEVAPGVVAFDRTRRGISRRWFPIQARSSTAGGADTNVRATRVAWQPGNWNHG